MKQIVLTSLLVLGTTTASAQTYMSHLREKGDKGNVVVNQSKEIDDLVNNAKTVQSKSTTNKKNENIKAQTDSLKHTHADSLKQNHADSLKQAHADSIKQAHADSLKQAREKEEHERKRQEAERQRQAEASENENNVPTIDLRKKVMRGGHKITGYRVQAYSGTNSRDSRLKAEKIRNTIKMNYPDQPVYVHFYSPRWICRVGNYRTLEEAQNMLTKLRKLGLYQATIVKGKITVQ